MKIRIKHWYLILLPLFFVACQGGADESEKTTLHGYKYKFVVNEEGEAPQVGQYIFYNYDVAVDDETLESSYGLPQLPRFGWTDPEKLRESKSPFVDALRLMSQGDSMVVYFPVDSLPNNNLGLEPGALIEYRVKVEEIMDEADYQEFVRQEQAELRALQEKTKKRLPELEKRTADLLERYKSGALEDSLQVTDSGLKYIVHKEGAGPVPETGDHVFVHYYGRLVEDGTRFDDSWSKGAPFRFNLGKRMVIPGWDEAFQLFPKGSHATLFIPHELAYGEAGSPGRIPERAELMFYVEMLEQ